LIFLDVNTCRHENIIDAVIIRSEGIGDKKAASSGDEHLVGNGLQAIASEVGDDTITIVFAFKLCA